MIPLQQEGPILCLEMKPSRPPSTITDDSDRFVVMMMQEESYKCGEYASTQVDSVCREKMCEWSFRVADHFHVNRPVVSVGFSFLDRFCALVDCDRSGFKLAAMTCLHIATKMLDREISVASLAELSRGEFDASHLLEMELLILQTLQWRMNPPTAQCFVQELLLFLPTSTKVTKAIYQRACFFCELALFDYSLIGKSKFSIALSAMLNAMEGMDDRICCLGDLEEFCEQVSQVAKVPACTDALRHRLWYLYSQSAQYYQDGAMQRTTLSSVDKDSCAEMSMAEKDGCGGELSPVSVSRAT